MIRVLIVDDEPLIRDLIKDSVDYGELGFEIAGEAEDGIQAFSRIEELNPQLVILDINIPFINGIELSKMVKTKYPDIKIIILTGYSDFEYAKECIKIGISDYVLKPIDPDNFKRILVDVKNNITKEIERKHYVNKLEKDARSGTDLLKEQFLNTLLSENRFDELFVKEQLTNYGLDLNNKSIVVITMEIDHLKSKWEKSADRNLWRFAIVNISNEIFSASQSSVTFYGPEDYIVCFANKNSNAPSGSDPDILSVCEEIREAAGKLLGISVTMGIGGTYSSYANIINSYRESIYAIQRKFFDGDGRIFEYQDIFEKNSTKSTFLSKSKDEILIILRTDIREAYVKMINDLLEELLKSRPSRETVRKAYADLAAAALEFAWENNMNTEDIFQNYIDCINSKETITELNNWMIELYDKVTRAVNNKNVSRALILVEKAKNYIEENYWKTDISLEEISERIFINPSYLSKVFKREMKFSVIEYLTDLRLKKAKEMVDSCMDIHIGFLAEKVGYTDPFYFSKLFKKYYGISPSKYIEKKRKPI